MSCGHGCVAASLQAFRDLKVHTSIELSHDKCKILTFFFVTGYLVSHDKCKI